MSNEWINNILTWGAIGAIAVGGIVQKSPDLRSVIAQSPIKNPEALPLPSGSRNTNSPPQLQVNLSVSSPEDLKVREGDAVTTGQVLADRVTERARLTSQRQSLQLSLEQIEGAKITPPPPPQPVPAVEQLPPIVYAEEEAAIAAARMNVTQAERAFQLQQQSLNSEPLSESSAVARAAVEVENRQRLVNNQLRKIDAVALLKGLPESVTVHEQEVLKQKQADLQQAQADYKQTQAQLGAASQAQTEKLLQLSAALEKARADQHLAIAKLQSKKDSRAYTEYEASVTTARRVEERNQAQQSYARQLQEHEQQQRDRNFQIAQLKGKVLESDNQLSALSVVTSPYSGVVKRLRINSQSDKTLSVELTLSTGSSTGSTPFPGSAAVNPYPSPQSAAPTSSAN